MVAVRFTIHMKPRMGNIWQCETTVAEINLSLLSADRYQHRGALEPRFFNELLRGLSIDPNELPGPREHKSTWPFLAELFATKFRSKPREEWERIFDHQDACCTPVLTQDELEEADYNPRPIVDLKSSPALSVSSF